MDMTRINNLAEYLKKANLGGLLVCPSEELLFLTGFTPKMCERFQGLFVTSEGSCFFVCNLLYKGEINNAYKGMLTIYTWMDGELMTNAVYAALDDHNLIGKTLGVNSTAPAFNTLDIARDCGVTFVNGLGVLEEARIIKSPAEIEDLRGAARIADEVFTMALKFIKPGMVEADISRFLTEKMAELGGGKPWAIVASGPNSSYPHYTGSSRVIEKQDMMILDFGCTVNGMYSDMSRTVFVGGITDEQREIYAIVRESVDAGQAAAVTGAFIPDVDKVSRDIIEKAGYGECFLNRLGHGIGYMIHEGPDIKKNNRRSLEPGMAFSIEPGIYIAGKVGMRIEDIVVATEAGNEVLNRSSKEIIIV
ncbi:MAG: Xaa-Pro peptidase family protein [Defluviitaleaceae bacterium]|nr:Xaa-Pro peptidase family protein [Defluviitaleaceae bacterium]MCL2836735.1 Xaa-Pro peptidase family protein [Defluviitaleaceae bacterium]